MKENEKLARQMCIYLSHKYSSTPLKEIAVKFNAGVIAIGESSKQIQKEMEEDKALKKLMGNLTTKINKWDMES